MVSRAIQRTCDAVRVMSVDTGKVVPRSEISLGVAPTLRGRLAQLAATRVLVIDYFASRRCSLVIGDLTVDFENEPPGPGYAELASIELVRVFAESRLLAILGDAGFTLRLGGPPFARHLAVDLDRPERWIDFLDQPGVLARSRPFRWRRL
jgi:hypothetical protein